MKVTKSRLGRPAANIVFPKTKTFFKCDIEALNPDLAAITIQKRLEKMRSGGKNSKLVVVGKEYLNGGRGRPMTEYRFRAVRKSRAKANRLQELKATSGEVAVTATPEVVTA